jgi:hypothetical protein
MAIMTKAIKLSVIFSLVFLLTACGGGGGDSASVANVDAQGFWTGPSPAGFNVKAVVLDTGETWGIYSSGSVIYGALYGNTTTSGSTATATGWDFNFLTATRTASTLTGPVTAKSNMSLSNAYGTTPLTYQSSYDTPATAAAAAGTWSFIGRSSLYQLIPATVTIDNSGNFVLNQTSCTTVGNVVPRAGGKNIYNVTLTATGFGCAAGQSSLTGVVYIDTTVSPNQFLGLALNSGKTDGLIVIGTKQ